MRWRIRLPAIALGLAVALSAACSGDSGQVATITFRFSRFESGDLTVKAGQPVTFILRNADPIAHEWIVGSEEVHQRHRTGTEPDHDHISTEVTVEALTTEKTTVIFDQPGRYTFICHLPGHEAYGMKGALTVLAQ